MSGDPDPGGLPAATSMANLQGPLPPELWGLVLSKADHKSLKAARRVNSIFRELATPLLFDHVVYSVDERTLKNLRLLAKNEHLSRHVESLYLDTTSYRQGVDTRRYSQFTASYLQNAFELPKQPNQSPLSEQGLLRILRADPAEDLGAKCLSGAARRAYVAGYSTYLARSDYYREQLQDDGIYKQLKDLIPKFANLKHVETITLWSPQDSRTRFESFLRRTLPESTLKTIQGLKDKTALSSDSKLSLAGAYCAPGQTSRRLNPLTPPPNFSGCWGDSTMFDILTAAFRAFHECKTKLEGLSLPGSDNLGEFMSPKDRMGIIPVPALLTIPRSTPEAAKKTLLLPLFQNLKLLELKLDFAHPRTQSTFKHHMDPLRLCTALQQMSSIESISLGAVDYPEEALADPWSIYETMLRSEDDDKALLPDWAEDTIDDDDDDDGGLGPGGLPAGMQNLTLAMLAASLGIPPPPGAGPPPQAGAAPNAAMPAASNATNPASTPQIPPPDAPSPKIHPSGALKPNPWPKLKHLNLFNMPATKEDLCRLFRTVTTLKTLELQNVYLDDRLQTHNGTVSSPTSPPSYPYEKIAPHWVEIIDLMGDEMQLQKATIVLSERDTDYLWDLLTESVDGFGRMVMHMDVDDLMDRYLTEEDARGMDFASFVGGVVEDLEDDDDLDWEDDDEEDEEDEESESEDTDEELPALI